MRFSTSKIVASLIASVFLVGCSTSHPNEKICISVSKPYYAKDIGIQYVIAAFTAGKFVLEHESGKYRSDYFALVTVTNIPSVFDEEASILRVSMVRKEGSLLCSQLDFDLVFQRGYSASSLYFRVEPVFFYLVRPRAKTVKWWLGRWLKLDDVDIMLDIEVMLPDDSYSNGISSARYKAALYNVRAGSVLSFSDGDFRVLTSSVFGMPESDFIVVRVNVVEENKIYKWMH